MRLFTFLVGLTGICGAACLFSCTHQETRTFRDAEIRLRTPPPQKIKWSAKPTENVIDSKTIVIDSRTPFEYSLSRVPGSISMQWNDFAQKEPPFLGLLEKDMFFHARRISRMGIGPDSKVLVIGKGPNGGAEEGRIAWTLQYLGVKDVTFTKSEHFVLSARSETPPPRPPASLWKPVLNADLNVELEEFQKILVSPRVSTDSPVILDVRDTEDYKKNQKLIDLAAINIPWRNFYIEADPEVLALSKNLEALGIHKTRKIILIDSKGVGAALATIVLRELGYQASCFSGGYEYLQQNLDLKIPPEKK